MNSQPDEAPEHLPSYQEVTIDEAAVILGRSPSTVRRMVRRGHLETIKASTPTGFVYRIRLASDTHPPLPTQGINAQIQRSGALEGILAAFESKLASLVEVNDRQGRRLEELAAENATLRAQLEAARASWWRRIFGQT